MAWSLPIQDVPLERTLTDSLRHGESSGPDLLQARVNGIAIP